MTVKEWLDKVSSTNQSDDKDSRMMQNLLRRVGFPNAVVTLGIVYLSGYGNPVDIHSTAKMMLEKVPA